ncbi:DUF3261 domain-containing protein [Vibrio agarivorans]|uniref:DUF3261 domain-containing protein n=1 Tax=Vibrio agarivorans TaxID=153622 RepID=UPI002231B00E|nr:DUF3261 domain-containing protein [Vibrio agarivorans]
MTRSFITWLVALLSMTLLGCAKSPHDLNAQSEVDWLPSPASYQGRLHTQQLMTIEYQQRQHRLQMILEIDPSQVTLVGLSNFSVPVFNMSWDGVDLNSRSSLPVDTQVFSAQRVMEDIMLALWPSSALESLLSYKGWSMEQHTVQRHFLDKYHHKVMTIDYLNPQDTEGVIHVHYHDLNVSYQLETLLWDATNE